MKISSQTVEKKKKNVLYVTTTAVTAAAAAAASRQQCNSSRRSVFNVTFIVRDLVKSFKSVTRSIECPEEEMKKKKKIWHNTNFVSGDKGTKKKNI